MFVSGRERSCKTLVLKTSKTTLMVWISKICDGQFSVCPCHTSTPNYQNLSDKLLKNRIGVQDELKSFVKKIKAGLFPDENQWKSWFGDDFRRWVFTRLITQCHQKGVFMSILQMGDELGLIKVFVAKLKVIVLLGFLQLKSKLKTKKSMETSFSNENNFKLRI